MRINFSWNILNVNIPDVSPPLCLLNDTDDKIPRIKEDIARYKSQELLLLEISPSTFASLIRKSTRSD